MAELYGMEIAPEETGKGGTESRDDWWKSDRVDGVGWAALLLWGALVVVAENTSFRDDFDWWEGWGVFFIGAGVTVYEGMIVGENSRPGDMDVNPTKEKKLTNIRTHSHDEALRLTPPPPMTLESAIEFIAADELVEVTPEAIRLRKRLLSVHDRRRERGREEDLRRSKERETAGAS